MSPASLIPQTPSSASMKPRTDPSRRYLSAEPRNYDDFHDAFTLKPKEVVYDALTVMGHWACMTQASFETYALGKLGVGFGQKYIRQPNGELHKEIQDADV